MPTETLEDGRSILRRRRRAGLVREIEELITRYAGHADYMAGVSKSDVRYADEADDYADAATALRSAVEAFERGSIVAVD